MKSLNRLASVLKIDTAGGSLIRNSNLSPEIFQVHSTRSGHCPLRQVDSRSRKRVKLGSDLSALWCQQP